MVLRKTANCASATHSVTESHESTIDSTDVLVDRKSFRVGSVLFLPLRTRDVEIDYSAPSPYRERTGLSPRSVKDLYNLFALRSSPRRFDPWPRALKGCS